MLRRVPLTDRSLLRMLVRHPLLTQRTIGLIHWHALRLGCAAPRSSAMVRLPPRSGAAQRARETIR